MRGIYLWGVGGLGSFEESFCGGGRTISFGGRVRCFFLVRGGGGEPMSLWDPVAVLMNLRRESQTTPKDARLFLHTRHEPEMNLKRT